MKDSAVKKLTTYALIVALAYVVFQFIRLDIPVGTERTSIHLGNAIVVIGALLEGFWGGFAGALGLTLADLTSGYLTSAPKTFILKLIIGLVASLVYKAVKNTQSKNKTETTEPETNLTETEPNKKTKKMLGNTKAALIASIASLGLNVVLDPIFGYYYKTYIIGIPQDMAATLSKIGSATTLANAIVSTIVVTLLWPVLSAALNKTK